MQPRPSAELLPLKEGGGATAGSRDRESGYSWGADGEGGTGAGAALPCSQVGEERQVEANFGLLLKTGLKVAYL